jgi:DNA-binding transcriptional LysR family regulator
MSDLDLRKIRYFLALAKHLNYSRAAEELHIAQPVLSRQIRALEQELRVPLFVRDHRGTQLTKAGEQLLEDAPALIEQAGAVQRRINRAARGTNSFVVGFMPGLIVTGPVQALRAAHPTLSVEVLRTSWDDQVAVILDARVDVGLIRLPVMQRGLRVERLFSEPRMVMLPIEHRLAGKDEVSITDFADEHLLQDPDAVPEWRDIATELRQRFAQRARPHLRTVEEKLEHVASGQGISILPASTAGFYRRPDVTGVHVADLAPNQVCLAWQSGRRSKLVNEFAELARSHLGGRPQDA